MARIAFVQNTFMEYFGIMYMSSLLKAKGHKVEVFIEANTKRLVNEIKRFNPDIVGFTCTTGNHYISLQVSRAIKSYMKVITIFGGPHPTFFPEIIEEDGVDVVCRGEGEYSLLDLAGAVDFDSKIINIPNLWVKEGNQIIKNGFRPLIEDLDTLPFPDRSIYYSKYSFMNNSRKIFIAGRGCPYHCTYCFNDSLQDLYKGNGRYVRLRSAKDVIAEIEATCKEYDAKTVYMMDDTFILNKPWLFDFLDHYENKIKLPFICLVRADLIDEDIVKRLKLANCYSVFFGLESGDENLRNLILGKKITDKQIFEAASLLKEYKIRFRTYNMLGIPGENLESAFKTVNLNIAIGTDYPWCSLLQPYPKTAINEYAQKNGILIDKSIPNYFFKKSIMNIPQIKEISNLQKLFYWTVKFPFLKPFVKNMIKLPSNVIFETLFLIGYGYSYYKSERFRLREVFMVAWRNVFSFISS